MRYFSKGISGCYRHVFNDLNDFNVERLCEAGSM
jgi:hypothetical protein